MYPRLEVRARHSAALGFATATIERPGSGQRPALTAVDQARAELRRTIIAGERRAEEVVDRLVLRLVEQAVPRRTGGSAVEADGEGERSTPLLKLLPVVVHRWVDHRMNVAVALGRRGRRGDWTCGQALGERYAAVVMDDPREGVPDGGGEAHALLLFLVLSIVWVSEFGRVGVQSRMDR
jgi:hypothetical protein